MDYNRPSTPPPHYYGGESTSLTAQVNAVMRKVYVRMFIGLLISAFCALGVASSQAWQSFCSAFHILRSEM